jgi:ATP-dependent 26S proteasome regulatory subunit
MLTRQLTPNTRVALRSDSHTLHKILPNKVCVCVCVCSRERERERVCVCVRARIYMRVCETTIDPSAKLFRDIPSFSHSRTHAHTHAHTNTLTPTHTHTHTHTHACLTNTQVDPLVSLMMVEKVPDSTYEMVGGLEKQIKEIKEVCTHTHTYTHI